MMQKELVIVAAAVVMETHKVMVLCIVFAVEVLLETWLRAMCPSVQMVSGFTTNASNFQRNLQRRMIYLSVQGAKLAGQCLHPSRREVRGASQPAQGFLRRNHHLVGQ